MTLSTVMTGRDESRGLFPVWDNRLKGTLTMAEKSNRRVTDLLARASDGDPRVSEELLPLLYGELRKLARARMAFEKPGLTLQPTALVHEAYMRLVGATDVRWDGRGHFFAAAAEAMRRILIERARRYARLKHGGELRRIDLEEAEIAFGPRAEELLTLDHALKGLEEKDPIMSEVVKLRYFAGLTVAETASALDLAPRTVNRVWKAAKAWLYREMSTGRGPVGR